MDKIQRVASAYTKEKNILKVLEECAELSEVLLKYLTKAEGYKPGLPKIVEEMGDVIYRCKVLARVLNIEQNVEDRVMDKTRQIDEHLDSVELNKN